MVAEQIYRVAHQVTTYQQTGAKMRLTVLSDSIGQTTRDCHTYLPSLCSVSDPESYASLRVKWKEEPEEPEVADAIDDFLEKYPEWRPDPPPIPLRPEEVPWDPAARSCFGLASANELLRDSVRELKEAALTVECL